MVSKAQPRLQFIVLSVLIPILLVASAGDSFAHKRKRNYNPRKGKAIALDVIRSSSQNISELAGLEPVLVDSPSSIEEGEVTSVGEEGENLEELALEDDITVDIEQFKTLWLSYVDEDNLTVGGLKKQPIMDAIMDWLGTPYRFGGVSKSGIDCSAFTQRIFLSSQNLLLPRIARYQFTSGTRVKRSQLQFGDMVFFHTYSYAFPSHVGIYLGDNLFAHAGSRYGVTISSLENTYYKKRFIGGTRIILKDVPKYSANDDDDDSNASEQ